MKQNNKLKRRLMNMCSDKSDNHYPQDLNKKKRSKETFNKNPTHFHLSSESGSKVPFYNENLSNNQSKTKALEETQDVKNENKSKNDKKDKFCPSNKMFIDKGQKPYNLNINDTAGVTRKGCTGSNNWEKFLIQHGKRYVIDKTPAELQRKQKTYSLKSKLTKVVGMDCEMVGGGEDGKDNLLARVSIVNLYGDCLYDKFVKPRETVTDYRTHISGVRATDLKKADDFETVQNEVADLIKGRILVGHAIKNDLEVLYLLHPRHQIRDTAKFFRKKGSGTPSLKNLAAEYLQVKIQSGEHSSVQDAQAAVQLYNMYRKKWETGGGNKKTNRIDSSL